MRIVNPTFGRPELVDDSLAHFRVTPGTETICVFSNSKPNATDLLKGMAQRIEEAAEVPEIGFISKPNAAVAGEEETFDWLAERYQMAVLATGD
jgi:thioredoxin reductase (NADPH)